MESLKHIARVGCGVFATFLVVAGLMMFAADCWSLAGHDISVHGDGPAGGIIVGPLTVFIGVCIFAWLWNTRSVLD